MARMRFGVVCLLLGVSLWVALGADPLSKPEAAAATEKKLSVNGSTSLPAHCGTCVRDACVIPRGCAAGVSRDECDCCSLCAKSEGELCDHPAVTSPPPGGAERVWHGRCGDMLTCRRRHDAPQQRDEAVCVCDMEGPVCGSDNVTYASFCSLTAAASALTRAATAGKQAAYKVITPGLVKLTVAAKGACKTAPVIVSPPEHFKDKSGKNSVLVCEAKGNPIPTIEWTWTRVDGKTMYLPNDDRHIAVNSRGGPEKYYVTGWLQVMNMRKEHEGDYTCISQNELGLAQGTARINVIS